MCERVFPFVLGTIAAASVFATAVAPAGAVEQRVRQCQCREGFVPRYADPNDFVCVTQASAQLIKQENAEGF
jgi:hypothetical protein